MTRIRRLRALVALVALALLSGACFGDGADDINAEAEADEETVAELPEWLQKVYPPPGSETSATRALQVNYLALGQDNLVRLVLDDVDVTTYATEGPGLLEYDPDQESAPVELSPGEHTAVVQLYRVGPGASEGVESFDPAVHDLIDSYTWSFTVL